MNEFSLRVVLEKATKENKGRKWRARALEKSPIRGTASLSSSLPPLTQYISMVSFYEVLQAVSRSKVIQSQALNYDKPSLDVSDFAGNEFANSIPPPINDLPARSPRSSLVSHRESIWTLEGGVNVESDEIKKLQEVARLLKARFAQENGHGDGGSTGTILSIPVRTIPLSYFFLSRTTLILNYNLLLPSNSLSDSPLFFFAV